MTQSKHWCLTINNPLDVCLPADLTPYKYFILGREVGESGTPHLQIYLCLHNRLRMRQVKILFPTAHIERMRGTPLEASSYCKKEGDFEEYG